MTCPNCEAELVEVWTDCADDDPECDCDAAYDCPSCHAQWLDPCGAHTGAYDTTTRALLPKGGT